MPVVGNFSKFFKLVNSIIYLLLINVMWECTVYDAGGEINCLRYEGTSYGKFAGIGARTIGRALT